ncbi:sonic hedgehog protein A [Fopius arisanus]|uniref:Hedgehog protein n=2 Tax=Fopius arisanus TaxID=64838 RepID=A0A9R1TNE9_9HYME|nr:PREDICTED: sonic hedgehog protein A [Fopius arisanus]
MVELGGKTRLVSYLQKIRNNDNYQRCRTRRRYPPRILIVVLLVLWLPALEIPGVLACGPGRGGGRRPILRKLTPLVFKQHVPNVSENTLPASGLPEGRVSRDHTRFRDLVPNYNADIIFKDEEGTGADRLMTQRCKEKLNTLAISVMNQWPGVKLRVTEGWDEEGKHATDSLHYEGRAVDVTTSDRDRSKYGMLARLAVEAGFDWVYYESRSHIHCSVKSESSSVGKSGGCFPGSSSVLTPSGPKLLSSLGVGEAIASLDSAGEIVFSEVIAFLDYAPSSKRQFIRLSTSSGRQLTLTPSHLVPTEPKDLKTPSSIIYAAKVQVGDRILVRDDDRTLPGGSRVRWDDVIEAELVLEEGVYAPLTREGTIVVDDVVASCYAIVNSQTIAQVGFFPLRLLSTITDGLQSVKDFFWHSHGGQDITTNEIQGSKSMNSRWRQPEGLHWYANFLYSISTYVLPSSMLY